MLVITRQDGEFVNLYIEGRLFGRVTATQDGYCRQRIAFDFPPTVKIMRAELGFGADVVTAEQLAAAQAQAELAAAAQAQTGKE